MHELQVTSYFYCTSYELSFGYELRVLFITRITSYFLHRSYELQYIGQFTSYILHTSYELLFTGRVTRYFSYERYKLLFTERVTSCFLTMSCDKDKTEKRCCDSDVMINIYSLGSFLIKNLGFA